MTVDKDFECSVIYSEIREVLARLSQVFCKYGVAGTEQLLASCPKRGEWASRDRIRHLF